LGKPDIEFVARVISLWRVTIPFEVRQALNIHKGDLLRIRIIEKVGSVPERKPRRRRG